MAVILNFPNKILDFATILAYQKFYPKQEVFRFRKFKTAD